MRAKAAEVQALEDEKARSKSRLSMVSKTISDLQGRMQVSDRACARGGAWARACMVWGAKVPLPTPSPARYLLLRLLRCLNGVVWLLRRLG